MATKMAAATSQMNANLLILPQPKTEILSSKFMKRVTGVAISTIVYARNLFDESDFSIKRFEGIDVRIVKGTPKNSKGARCLSTWLEGAFDALDHKYLKSLSFEIKNDTGCLLETYEFIYTYKDNGTQCAVIEAGQKLNLTPSEVGGETRDSVRNLIRSILIMTSSMSQLPPKCTTTVKIRYYEEVTPEDYEPPGFQTFIGDKPEFSGVTSKWTCGQVETPFHTMGVKTRQLSAVIPTKSGRDAMLVSKSVDCLCKKTDNIGSMLHCVPCNTLQHSACYKVLTEEEASQKSHECMKCSGKSCGKEYDETECIFRRVLALCVMSKSVSVSKVQKALDLDGNSTMLQLRRLQREGAVPKSTQPFSLEKPDFLYIIKKDHILKVLKQKYFN